MLGGSTVALDVGTTATRVMWLKTSGGKLTVERAEAYGPTEESSVEASLLAAKNAGVPTNGVVLGASGQTATLRYNMLPPVPDWRLEMILKYETEEMAEKSGEPLSSDFLRLEIPESESDDQILLVGYGKEHQIQPVVEEMESAGGRVRMVVPQAMGLFHAYLASVGGTPAETVLVADVGARETNLVLIIDGRLIFARSVNFGGEQVDESIAGALDIREDQGRKFKEGMEEGKIPADLVQSAQSAIRSAKGQLVRVLESSISFCRLQAKIPELKADRILVSGGTARLPGLADYLTENLKTPVALFEPPVAGDLPGHPAQWVVPFGLCVNAMASKDVIDLLPAPAKAKREFRERTVFLHGGAAVLALALLVAFVVSFFANSSAAEVADQLGNAKSTAQSKRQEEATLRRKNQVYRQQIERMQKELLATRFQGEVMVAIRDQLPEAIWLESIELERLEQEGELALKLIIKGRADDADSRGLEYLRDLRGVLERQPTVVSNKVVGSVERDDDGTFPFELEVLGTPPLPETKKKTPRRGQGRRGN